MRSLQLTLVPNGYIREVLTGRDSTTGLPPPCKDQPYKKQTLFSLEWKPNTSHMM